MNGLQGSEESSEYTSSDDEEDEHGQVMLKPAFVPKTEREVRTHLAGWLAKRCL